MTESKEIEGVFRYEKDSKRYHRFQIETEAGIVGKVYVPKTMVRIPVMANNGKDAEKTNLEIWRQ